MTETRPLAERCTRALSDRWPPQRVTVGSTSASKVSLNAQAKSRVLFCLGSAVFRSYGFFLTHICAALCGPVTLGPREVVNFRRQIHPNDCICGTLSFCGCVIHELPSLHRCTAFGRGRLLRRSRCGSCRGGRLLWRRRWRRFGCGWRGPARRWRGSSGCWLRFGSGRTRHGAPSLALFNIGLFGHATGLHAHLVGSPFGGTVRQRSGCTPISDMDRVVAITEADIAWAPTPKPSPDITASAVGGNRRRFRRLGFVLEFSR